LWRYALLALTLLLGAGLRLHLLGASALRGDEAFALRYWAGDWMGLVNREPHPVAVFIMFSGWKALVGQTEFAMRMLPALLNLLGVAAMFALGKRLFRDARVANLAALLWALNPFLIWHSQDLRDYAIWAAFSALALWALLRAAQRNHRRDWIIYAALAALALNSFFFEILFTIAGGAYILLFRPRALRNYMASLALLAVLLVPWLWQAAQLAGSAYGGTLGGLNLPELLTLFPATFIFGEQLSLPAWAGLAIILIIGAALLWMFKRGEREAARTLALLIGIPLALFVIACTRMNIFAPRYLLALEPMLLLPLAFGIVQLWRWRASSVVVHAVIRVALAAGLLFVASAPLWDLWYSGYSKSQDWRALHTYIAARYKPADTLVFNTSNPRAASLDPAFAYYFPEQLNTLVLPKAVSSPRAWLTFLATRPGSVWFMPGEPFAADTDLILRNTMQPITDRRVGANWQVREFRPNPPWQSEPAQALSAKAGDAKLRGYSLDQTAQELTVLLYWERVPLQTVFVQLIGSINPKTGTPLWAQDDHPADGPRDVHTLLLRDVPPGSYTLQVGLYPPEVPAQRTLWENATDALVLATISIQ